MTCERMRDNLSAYVDGELTPEESAAVEAHLRGCSNCRKEMASLRSLSRLVAALPRESAPQDFSAAFAPAQLASRSRGATYWVRILWPAAAAACIALALRFAYTEPHEGRSRPPSTVAMRDSLSADEEVKVAPRRQVDDDRTLGFQSDGATLKGTRAKRAGERAPVPAERKQDALAAAVMEAAPTDMADAPGGVAQGRPAETEHRAPKPAVPAALVLRADQPLVAMADVRALAARFRAPRMRRLEAARMVAADTAAEHVKREDSNAPARAMSPASPGGGGKAKMMVAKTASAPPAEQSVTVSVPPARLNEFLAALKAIKGVTVAVQGPTTVEGDRGAVDALADRKAKDKDGIAEDVRFVTLTIRILPAATAPAAKRAAPADPPAE